MRFHTPSPRRSNESASRIPGGASSARGGFDQFLRGRNGDQEQLHFSLFHLLKGGELLRFPGVRGWLTFRNGVESREPDCSQRGEVLRADSYFFNQEGALGEGLQPGVIIAPGGEL